MKTLRNWAVALGLSVLALGVANRAEAGFLGDTVSVSLTVHTAGATDQTVWSNDPAVIGSGVELTGTSSPGTGGDILNWAIDLDDLTITLTVTNPNAVAWSVDPLTLVISGLDAMPLTSAVISTVVNDFGFTNAQLSIAGDTLTLYAPSGLNLVNASSSLSSTIVLAVPEASSVVMMLLAGGVAGGLAWRRRKIKA
ncbi:MAG: PEP-CTERM sorting domain-containing protein [Planctomycetota bacterium]